MHGPFFIVSKEIMTELTNSLEQYLEELGLTWIDRRQRELEPKWNRNLMMVKGEDPFPPWKKDDGGTTEGKEWRSDIVINIVRPKIYSVLAMLLDILLPNGMVPFDLEVPEADIEGAPPEIKAASDTSIKKMKSHIKKQRALRRCDRQYTKKILSLLYYSIAWSKYNIKQVKQKTIEGTNQLPSNVFPISEQTDNTSRYTKSRKKRFVPGHDFRSVWSVYWDMEVDADELESGQGVFDRDIISLYDLEQKKFMKGYIPATIDKVIDEKSKNIPSAMSLKPGLREMTKRKLLVDNREYWVRVPRHLVDVFEKDEFGQFENGEEAPIAGFYDEEETGDDVFILAETANGRIIKYKRREDGSLVHKMCVWEENLDDSSDPGTCPPDNLKFIQQLYTGLVRAFIDNKKLAANIIVALKREFLEDSSQVEGGLAPGSVIDITEDCGDARQAVQQLLIQDVGDSLLSGIGLADRWKDLVSNLPEMLQGFVLPKHKADTAYEMRQLMDNAGKYLGQVMRNIDEMFIEPETYDLYEYNMMDPTFDSNAKGIFRPIAGGFIAFKRKILIVQEIERLLALVLSHELLAGEAKLRPHLEIIYENLGFTAEKFLKTEEEKQQEQQQRIEQEAHARAQALQNLRDQAQIETESKIAEIEAKGGVELEKIAAEGGEDSGQAEESFQRDIIKKAIGSIREEAGG